MKKDENIQLAENLDIDNSLNPTDYIEKRNLLKKTKILRQTWSILEIFQKINTNKLILDPAYQRKSIWKMDKKIPFIESLYMGIIIPPIYVVEITGENVLDPNRYEVVDGKQRLTTIIEFLKGETKLDNKYLEYFGDIFDGKFFKDIEDDERSREMLSSVLDIYVITANSPEFTKYDIFSRINKGAEKLRINEIRKAIYRSEVLENIQNFVNEQLENKESNYKKLFSEANRDRYEDFGTLYKALSFYINTNLELEIVEGYNSRPREMINSTLQKFQNKEIYIGKEDLEKILNNILLIYTKIKDINKASYLLDSIIPFTKKNLNILDNIDEIISNDEIKNTLEKSPGTTCNINERVKIINSILRESI